MQQHQMMMQHLHEISQNVAYICALNVVNNYSTLKILIYLYACNLCSTSLKPLLLPGTLSLFAAHSKLVLPAVCCNACTNNIICGGVLAGKYRLKQQQLKISVCNLCFDTAGVGQQHNIIHVLL